jgi:hypothetical protein
MLHIWLPHAPLRGAYGILGRRFAGRFRELFSMRRTATMEPPMSAIQHPHAACRIGLLSQFVRNLTKEFGSKGIAAVVERFIEAEQADFCWERRISERSRGVYEDGFDEGKDPRAKVGSARKEPRTREKNHASC